MNNMEDGRLIQILYKAFFETYKSKILQIGANVVSYDDAAREYSGEANFTITVPITN